MLLKVIMRRVFTVTQWEALLLLILGITVNQLSVGELKKMGGSQNKASHAPCHTWSRVSFIYFVFTSLRFQSVCQESVEWVQTP